jgi:hypothetical protein
MEHHCGSRSRGAVGALLVVAALLAACGGGGGGSSNGGNNGGGSGNPPPGLPYTGVTSAAALTSVNTPTIAGALLYEMGLASGSRPLPAQVAAPGLRLPDPARALGKVRQAKATFFRKPISTENCSQSGTVRIDDQTTSNGTGTLTLTFNACVEDGTRSDGVQRILIVAYDLARDEPTDFTITFEGYSENAGSFGLDIDGTVHAVVGLTNTTTYDAVTRYRPEGVQHRMQNLVVQEHAISSSIVQVTIQGRFFHSAHGYVDVETAEPLSIANGAEFPSAGVLRLRSSSAARADVRFDNVDQITLTLDENGDGNPERALRAFGLEGLRLTNHLPTANAGPDAAITQGQTVTLSGSGSDWEGAALTYQWWCEGAPNGGGFVIGAGPQTTFRPTTPGTYVIQLRVNDGQVGPLSFDSMLLTVLDNNDPVARAGDDVSTVERATVELDGGASTDTENDQLAYVWTLLEQPASDAAPPVGHGRTFSFAPGRPGNYRYRLTVSDEFGASQDEVSIFASGLVGFAFSSAVVVDPTTPPEFITRTVPINTSSNYSGPPVPLTVSSDVPWLEVVSAPAQTGANATVVVQIDTDELAALENGNHVATLTVTPTGYTPRSDQLLLTRLLPKIEHIAPYVAYTGQPSSVIMYGEQMHQTLGATLVINGIEVSGFTDVMLEHSRITLPALPAGEYDMHVKNKLGLVLPMGRVVVRDPPTYADGEVAMPGRIEALDYDMERDAFYAVSPQASPGASFEAWRLRFAGGQWHREVIPVAEPQGLSLNVDGTKLFVTSVSCTVNEVDPDTLQVLHTAARPGCFVDYFGMVVGLSNGRTVVADTNQWPTVYDYPSFSTSTIQFPLLVHSPTYALSRNRERLLWAGQPTISPPRTLHAYDVATDSFTQVAVHDPGTYFIAHLLALSGDGHRFMHSQDVYEDAQYIGSVQTSASSLVNPALTTSGHRAVVLNPDTDVLELFDLGNGPSFPKLGDVATLPDDVGAGRILLLPDDRVAFAFTTTLGPGGVSGYKLYVRNLP